MSTIKEIEIDGEVLRVFEAGATYHGQAAVIVGHTRREACHTLPWFWVSDSSLGPIRTGGCRYKHVK